MTLGKFVSYPHACRLLAPLDYHTCVRSGVPLEVEGVVETLPADGAEEPLHLAVALEVAGQVSLQPEPLVAYLAPVITLLSLCTCTKTGTVFCRGCCATY